MTHNRRSLNLETLETRRLLTVGLDASFGAYGIVSGPDPISHSLFDVPIASVAQRDKLVLASTITTGRGFELAVLSRYDADGSLDTTFGDDGKAYLPLDQGDEVLEDMINTPDGGLLTLFSNDGLPFVLAKFRGDGNLDTSFGVAGLKYVDNGFARPFAVVLGVEGGFFIASIYNGNQIQLSKHLETGELDDSFAASGFVRIPMENHWRKSHNLLRLGDGSFLLSYSSISDLSNYNLYIHRVLADGTIDEEFGDGGRFAGDPPKNSGFGNVTLLLDGAGDILVAGTTRTGDAQDFFVLKLAPSGNLVDAYGQQGIAEIPTGKEWGTLVQDAELLADGSLLLSGTIGSRGNPVTVRVDPTGQNWRISEPLKFVRTTEFSSTASSVGGRVLAAYSNAETRDISIVAFRSDGSIDSTFGSEGTVTSNLGESWNSARGGDVLELADGNLLTLTRLDLPYGFAESRELLLARRFPDGTIDPSYGRNGSIRLPQDLFISPDSYFFSFENDNYFFSTSENAINIFRVASDGTIDFHFGLQGTLSISRNRLLELHSVSAASDGFLVTGRGKGPDQDHYLFLKYDLGGNPVEAFGDVGAIRVPHAPLHCCLNSRLKPTADGGFLAQTRSYFGGSYMEIRRYDSNGQPDERFGEMGRIDDYWPIPSQIAVSENGNFFLVSTGGTKVQLRRFRPNGELDENFGFRGLAEIALPSGWDFSQPAAVEFDSQHRLVLAVNVTAGHDRDSLLMRVDQEGTLDKNFGFAGYLNPNLSSFDDTVSLLSLGRNGSIYFAGTRLTDQYQEAVFGRVAETGTPYRPWHNVQLNTDTNGDGVTTPLDALLLINFLNHQGSQPVPDDYPELGWYDVSGDNYVSPIDVLLIANKLNSAAEAEPLVHDWNASHSAFDDIDHWMRDRKKKWSV